MTLSANIFSAISMEYIILSKQASKQAIKQSSKQASKQAINQAIKQCLQVPSMLIDDRIWWAKTFLNGIALVRNIEA